jgi:dihydrodipicolinate synthase/N-acetylneuraminate lyase
VTAAAPQPLHGVLAAAVTPLRDGGARLDEDAFAPLVDRSVAGGLDGLLALGTTGEGILLSVAERRRTAERLVEAARGRLQVAVHCGAQTTADSVALAEHAAEQGADAVAVIAPPYYALDAEALHAHFLAVAAACAPTPYYVYEFQARSGYAVPLEVIARLCDAAPNLRGLKVSDTPFERFRPYLLEGLDVFVGPEGLIHQGLEAGAVGVVSGLAASFPELVGEVARAPSAEGAARLGGLRAALDGFPFQAALKRLLAHQGVPIAEDVRAPLRTLTAAERARLDEAAATPGSPIAAGLAAAAGGTGARLRR